MSDTYFSTREEWLQSAAAELAPRFEAAGYKLPAKLRFSCSWPAGSRGNSKKILGQCIAPDVSADGSTEIYVVPTVDCPRLALGVLMHELVHAAVGVRWGHRKPFADACRKLGLVGKPAQALPDASLTDALDREVLPIVGKYPHAAITLDAAARQSTRMLKVVCPVLKDAKGKPYMVRMTRAWIESHGLPVSPAGVQMVLADDGE